MSPLDLDVAAGRVCQSILAEILGEVRWMHPGFRICCGAFLDPGHLRFLASCQPSIMHSLEGVRVGGDDVARYRALLEVHDEIVTPRLQEDGRLASLSSTILGEDTRSTFVIPLRAQGRTLGFLRLDGGAEATFDERTLRPLRDAAASCLLAALLATTLAASERRAATMRDVRRWVRARIEHERAGLDGLSDALGELRAARAPIGLAGGRGAIDDAIEGVERALAKLRAVLDGHAEQNPCREPPEGSTCGSQGDCPDQCAAG